MLMTEGQVLQSSFESQILKNNPLKDPHIRKLCVYLPPSYEQSSEDYPVLFLLPAFASRGVSLLNRDGFSEGIDERLNRLLASKAIKPMIVVIPDCFTYYGGSQYRDSEAFGNYESYLIQEVVPHIKNQFRTAKSPSQWALAGHSSGGYGALTLALRHPELFGAFACQSGDMGFEYCYQPDFPEAMLGLERSGGSISEFMKTFYSLPKKDSASFTTLNVIAMAAAYSPNAKQADLIELPFDPKTGELKPAIWQEWLKADPVHMVKPYEAALRRLKIFVDCGIRDEFRLYAGARIFSGKLKALGIAHHYEEFPDGHMKTAYRYDRSLKFISDAIAG